MSQNEIICVTTFRQGNPENIVEKTRSEVFFDTVYKILDAGLSLVVIHIETRDSVLMMLQKLGVVLIE